LTGIFRSFIRSMMSSWNVRKGRFWHLESAPVFDVSGAFLCAIRRAEQAARVASPGFAAKRSLPA